MAWEGMITCDTPLARRMHEGLLVLEKSHRVRGMRNEHLGASSWGHAEV